MKKFLVLVGVMCISANAHAASHKAQHRYSHETSTSPATAKTVVKSTVTPNAPVQVSSAPVAPMWLRVASFKKGDRKASLKPGWYAIVMTQAPDGSTNVNFVPLTRPEDISKKCGLNDAVFAVVHISKTEEAKPNFSVQNGGLDFSGWAISK